MDGLLETWLMTFGLILARVSAFVATIPYLGGRFVPRLVKAGVALSLTCFWFVESGTTSINVVMAMSQQPWLAFGLAIGREVIVGCALGFIFGLFLVPFQVAGAYISQEMGLTLGSISDPTRPQVTTIMSEVFELFGVLLFFTQNVHHVFLAALHGSFARQPIGGRILAVPVASSLSAMAAATEWGLMLAAPVACCLFITSLVIALMARAAPQLNLMSFGFALRILVGLVATCMLWPDLAPQMGLILQRFSGLLIGR
ncbi:MAG: flagellar biosynthetic protein FliR [Planctomycetota bacterium]